MFNLVYNSKYIHESWETITGTWTYPQFLERYNYVQYLNDVDKANDRDRKLEEEKQKMQQDVLGRRGR